MSQPQTEWKVLPHGKLPTVEENILTVVGEIPMPLANITRRTGSTACGEADAEQGGERIKLGG
jgi:hypothetical protein